MWGDPSVCVYQYADINLFQLQRFDLFYQSVLTGIQSILKPFYMSVYSLAKFLGHFFCTFHRETFEKWGQEAGTVWDYGTTATGWKKAMLNQPVSLEGKTNIRPASATNYMT